MQAGGAARGAGAIPRRGRLEVLLAIAAVVAVTAIAAFLMWMPPLTTSGVGADDAVPGAGSAILHDDAGSMNRYSYPLPRGQVAAFNASNMGAGSAVVHDDAGNVPRGAGSAAVHDDAGNVNR